MSAYRATAVLPLSDVSGMIGPRGVPAGNLDRTILDRTGIEQLSVTRAIVTRSITLYVTCSSATSDGEFQWRVS